MIRSVRQAEIPHLYPFVFEILSSIELPLLDGIKVEVFEEIIIHAMHSPHYRYGYEQAWMCERDGQIAGVFLVT